MSSGKILIVDDEPQIRRVLRTTLTSQGYTVAEARTGDEIGSSGGRSKAELGAGKGNRLVKTVAFNQAHHRPKYLFPGNPHISTHAPKYCGRKEKPLVQSVNTLPTSQ